MKVNKFLLKKKVKSGTVHSGLIYLVPGLAIIISLKIYPLIHSLQLCFTDIVFSEGGIKQVFVGLENWIKVLEDPKLVQVSLITSIFSFSVVILSLVISLAIALLLNQDFKGRVAARAILLIPWAIPNVVNGQIWMWILQPEYGVLNTILLKLRLISHRLSLFTDPNTAMLAIIFAQTWKMVPMGALFFLAALQTVPKALEESAELDGASALQRIMHVILPYIKETIFFVVLSNLIDSFKIFDLVYVATRGGPADATLVYYLYIYRETFQYLHFGIGAVLSWILTGIITILALIYLHYLPIELKVGGT